ncbi:MAG: ATP-binding cassette domain-containing protein [Oscillospiraceae bacterium]|nr:ATP-binding cassette domain-containing protein [Oscillospiraceae bacterium]
MVSLAFSHLTAVYPEAEQAVLRDVSFSLDAGEFAVLCGATGCGKTTLLRFAKRELTPRCTHTGTVRFCGTPTEALDARTAAAQIGFVMQHPDQQIVTDRVWHELAFGLENLGVPQAVIRRRIAEIASYFGMEDWLNQDPSSLSGGQKQILNLASVMIMQPALLLLDEPTAQLDPLAAADFLTTLQRLNRDFSVTILLAEHRLGEVIPMADRLLIMDGGALTADGSPRDVLAGLPEDAPVMGGMPASVRLFRAVGGRGRCPLSVSDARRTLIPQFRSEIRSLPEPAPRPETAPALEFSGVYFRYARRAADVLSDLSFTVQTGEFCCLIGGNGAGKSTALSLAAGVHRPYAGKIRVFGKKIEDYQQRTLHRECVTLLPQDVQTVFLKNTVAEELSEIDRAYAEALSDFPFDLSPLLPMHPYDLSGGQQQIAALAKVMLTKPRLLLLDEPTKGLDAQSKTMLADVLHGLTAQGVTLLVVTHDIEFAAEHADRCGFLSQGTLISSDTPRRFFSENVFYTTAVSRMTRGTYDGAVTLADAAALCKLNGREETAT